MDKKWIEHEGVINFWVKSDGATGKEWITRLEEKGFDIPKWTKEVLLSPDFKPTKDVETEVAVLKGVMFYDNDRNMEKIRAEAESRTLGKPNAEVACLIREKFSDEEIEAMGLWAIFIMHEPIKDSAGELLTLAVERRAGGNSLAGYTDKPGQMREKGEGFAFVSA